MLVNISDNHPGFSQFEVDNALLSLNGTPVPHNLSLIASASVSDPVPLNISSRGLFYTNFSLIPLAHSS